MKLKEYKRIMTVIVFAIGVLIAYSVTQNSTFLAVVAVTFGMVFLHVLRRGLTEVEHDERTVIIRNRAASVTLAIITVSMAIIGLSLVFLSGQGTGEYEQIGYLLVYQANFILILNALLSYYYRNKLGG
jgi:uncharacterized membrane protein